MFIRSLFATTQQNNNSFTNIKLVNNGLVSTPRLEPGKRDSIIYQDMI